MKQKIITIKINGKDVMAEVYYQPASLGTIDCTHVAFLFFDNKKIGIYLDDVSNLIPVIIDDLLEQIWN